MVKRVIRVIASGAARELPTMTASTFLWYLIVGPGHASELLGRD